MTYIACEISPYMLEGSQSTGISIAKTHDYDGCDICLGFTPGLILDSLLICPLD